MSDAPRTWLVTGGCGFVGVNLVRRLLARDDSIRVLDDLSGGSQSDLTAVDPGGAVELIVGDVREPKAVAAALDGCDAVVHLAAQTGVLPSIEDPVADRSINVDGLVTVLEAARAAATRRVVFTSSHAPLGDHLPPLDERLAPRPLSPYGASKAAGEAYCRAYHGSYGVGAVVLRFANAYGPHAQRKGSVIAASMRRVLAGEPLIQYGDGRQTRDFVHTDDLTAAIVLAAEREGVEGGLFHIASGRETEVGDLLARIAALARRDLGRAVEIQQQPARRGEIRRSASDISLARRELGYAPGVELSRGLAEVWKWFQTPRGP